MSRRRPIVFTANPLDRAGARRGDAAWMAARLADKASRFLPLRELKPLINPGPAPTLAWQQAAALTEAFASGAAAVMLGVDGGVCHFAVDADGGHAEFAGKFIDARTIAPQLPAGEAAIMAQARSLIDWHRRHRFCAACGKPSRPDQGGYVRRCSDGACNAEHFPRTDPVTIMLVAHGNDLLLGRQGRFLPGVYSALAGFVEPGESIEEAVRREVAEEAGITVGEVRYLASQPWPFPSSLMIGCIGTALDREITRDGAELEDARWFSRDEVAAMAARSGDLEASPRLPAPMSIAYQLARMWLDGG
jgi:NAD+ diphosphatase